MQQTSDLYKELYAAYLAGSPNVRFKTTVVIDAPGVEEKTYGGSDLITLKTTGQLFPDGIPSVGNCIVKEINLSMLSPADPLPRQARIRPYVSLTDGVRESETIQKGAFYIDTRSETVSASGKKIITIHGYDDLLKSEQDYPTSTLGWPNYDVNVVREICTFLGLEIDSRTLSILNAGLNEIQYPAQYSCRETLGYIAAMYGGNFIMSDTGTLLLVQLGVLPEEGAENTTDLGRRMRSFSSSEALDGYSRVEVIVDENTVSSYPAESTGRTLTLECPWGKLSTAINLYFRLKDFHYQPYKAEQAILDPAAELGDGISANGIYSGIYTMDITFGPGFRATVSAPFEEELEHEYPYVSKQDRKINRKLGAFRSELEVQASQISAKVSKIGGSETESSSFGWELTDDAWTIQANGSTVLKASATGLEVYGKIDATSGSIGGFTIKDGYLSTRGQTWDGTDPFGIYIGPSGIKLGNFFKVDMMGTIYAEDGHFAGTVYAGMVEWGDDAGYMSGEGLYSGTIYGNRLVGNTITTAYTSTGINASLENGNWAANLFSGIADYNASIKIGTVSCTSLFQEGYGFYAQSVSFKDGSGNSITIPYWGWAA